MRSVAEHRALALAGLAPLGSEEIALDDVLGTVLAEDVVASGPLPAFDVSSMDGYAVRHADVADVPVTLSVVGDLPAGASLAAPLAPGTATRIMTGAPMPPGADAVVPVEATNGWVPPVGGVVRVDAAPKAGDFVRYRGEGVTAGAVLLVAGTLLGPRQVSLLGATGHSRVRVHRRPRVAVISTGNELVAAGEPLGFGQVHDANGPALAACARAAGARVSLVGRVGDDVAGFVALLARAAEVADLVVTSGGVSAGAYDVVKAALAAGAQGAPTAGAAAPATASGTLGPTGQVEFAKVAMQPGMPQGLGRWAGLPLFTLPGNPVSAWLSFEMFVRPAVARLRGLPDDHPRVSLPRTRARAAAAWRSPVGKRQFSRVVLEHATGAGDLPLVAPIGGAGSHLVRDLAVANALAVVPEDVGAVAAGDVLDCLLLDDVREAGAGTWV